MPQSRNAFLASLSGEDYSALQPHLRDLALPQAAVLFRAGEPIPFIVMPYSGIVSLVVDLDDDHSVECAMVGRDGIVGTAALVNGRSLCTAIVQAAITASVIDTTRLRDHADESPSCRAVLHRYELLIEAQSQQSAACNATHLLEARLARWLLRCRDLLESDDLSLTQEYIAQMLGVRRTTVTITAQALQTAGLIRYSRGRIRILSADRLRLAACGCYDAVKSYSETLIEKGGSGTVSRSMPHTPASLSP
jgi:CRP-like cAMP-binding protein